MNVIDFTARDCGDYGWLPIIQVVKPNGDTQVLYRGEHKPSADIAFYAAREAWNGNHSFDIKQYKKTHSR